MSFLYASSFCPTDASAVSAAARHRYLCTASAESVGGPSVAEAGSSAGSTTDALTPRSGDHSGILAGANGSNDFLRIWQSSRGAFASTATFCRPDRSSSRSARARGAFSRTLLAAAGSMSLPGVDWASSIMRTTSGATSMASVRSRLRGASFQTSNMLWSVAWIRWASSQMAERRSSGWVLRARTTSQAMMGLPKSSALMVREAVCES